MARRSLKPGVRWKFQRRKEFGSRNRTLPVGKANQSAKRVVVVEQQVPPLSRRVVAPGLDHKEVQIPREEYTPADDIAIREMLAR